MEALSFLFNRRLILAQRRYERLMSRRTQEFDQIGALKTGGARVDQRMKVEPFMAHHRFIQHDGNLSRFVIDCAEWRDGAGPNAPDLFQQFRRPERNAPLRPDFLMHPLEVDRCLFAQDEQEKAAFLVLDEQVFGVAARNVAAQNPRILNREQRRMIDGLGLDAERGQIGEQIFG